MEQRTDSWFAARAGKVTASAIYKVMARTKTGWGADRANYMAQLVSERLTGRPADSFSNSAMQWGVDTEPQARAMYELETGQGVVECGFYNHPEIEMSGASPDGLIGENGLIEIKCPNTATHIATLRGAEIEGKYIKQMQWQMACTGTDWCDFVSFDPRLPDEMQLHIRRVERDNEMIADIAAHVIEFLAEVDAAIADLTTRYRKAA